MVPGRNHFNPIAAILKLPQFRLLHFVCLSYETLYADGIFSLVSMPGEEMNPTYYVNG